MEAKFVVEVPRLRNEEKLQAVREILNAEEKVVRQYIPNWGKDVEFVFKTNPENMTAMVAKVVEFFLMYR